MKPVIISIIASGSLALSLTATGHHSFLAQYNADQIITVSGVVTEVWYQNPHTRVYVEAENENGETELWEMETYPRNSLARRGWRHDDLVEGDEVVVTGRRARDGGTRLQVLTIVRPADGWEGIGYDIDSVD